MEVLNVNPLGRNCSLSWDGALGHRRRALSLSVSAFSQVLLAKVCTPERKQESWTLRHGGKVGARKGNS